MALWKITRASGSFVVRLVAGTVPSAAARRSRVQKRWRRNRSNAALSILTDAFPTDPELRCHLFERVLTAGVDPVSQFEHFPLTLLQRPERLSSIPPSFFLQKRSVREGCTGIGHELAEHGTFRDRGVERHHRYARSDHMSHSLFGESRGCGKLLDGGVATQPAHESSARSHRCG